jgi:hypothetical protein
MLTAFLFMVVLGLLLAMVAVGIGVGLMVRAVADRNRLHPAIETGAPLAWCWSPSAPARLHRRLQSALLPLPAPRSGRRRSHSDSLADLTSALVHQAGGVDREVILASRRHGPARRADLRRVRADVRTIEVLAGRLQERHAGVSGAAAPPRQQVFEEVGARLDLLDRAHAELTAIERASTLDDPDAILRRIAPPAPPVERGATPPSAHRHGPTRPGPRPRY